MITDWLPSLSLATTGLSACMSILAGPGVETEAGPETGAKTRTETRTRTRAGWLRVWAASSWGYGLMAAAGTTDAASIVIAFAFEVAASWGRDDASSIEAVARSRIVKVPEGVAGARR